MKAPLNNAPGDNVSQGSINIPQGEKLDRNYAKKLIGDNIEIISNCFNINAPKSVQKLGLFEIQDVLNDFKVLYTIYIETFLSIEADVREIVLGLDKSLLNQEIYFSLGNNSFNYVVKSDPD
jgi:hypothetical protein